MKKIDLSKMSGDDLFEYYTSQPGEYKATLFQAHLEIGDKLFPMLEKCEKTGKKITLKEDVKDALDSPISVIMK